MIRTDCRICRCNRLKTIINFGKVPLANSFTDGCVSAKKYPLKLVYCTNCFHVQLSEAVSAFVLWEGYKYFTGTSKPMHDHFVEFVNDVLGWTKLSKKDIVVDVGSNDGTLLQKFKKKGYTNVLGIDPSEPAVALANKNGVFSVNMFFNERVSRLLSKKFGRTKLLIGTNVLAHNNHLTSFLEGVYSMLEDDGTFVVEVPYVVDLLKYNEFDTIYHEHMSYFSVSSLVKLFKRYKLNVVHVKKVRAHGGSLRVFVKKENFKPCNSVYKFISYERNFGLFKPKTYTDFRRRIEKYRLEFRKLVLDLVKNGNIIAAYGATAKSTVLLNYCGFKANQIRFITDTTPAKQGKFSPGTKIPVVAPDILKLVRPDYLLLTAWNYSNQILAKEKTLRSRGVKFIIPFPRLKVV